ncbi:MAG: hypothetical protein HYT76_06345 [Deltaproteobacteria bacterium]|nr:hypothetical protein [Deltaproteobacteria bacterium]
MTRILLPSAIGDGRLDTLLRVFSEIRVSTTKRIDLDWTRVTEILPAGYAILACLFDAAVEHSCRLENVFLKKRFHKIPLIQNLMNISQFKSLPRPGIHDSRVDDFILSGGETSLNMNFMDQVEAKFGNLLSEDLAFSCRLIFNELMQNSVDHSTAERYYAYAGSWKTEFHIGVLDMGITIPAKLEQKYSCANDVEYLMLCPEVGISTRRQRLGGLGLSHTLDLLKGHQGRLIMVSRDAQMRRYFKRRHIVRGRLKHRLNGTWCFTRFPL